MRESLKQMKIQDMEQHKRGLEMKMKFVDADFIRETSRRPDETYNIANLKNTSLNVNRLFLN